MLKTLLALLWGLFSILIFYPVLSAYAAERMLQRQEICVE
jgi:hypothetical protein